jgi:hypothetical protein
MAGGKIRHHDLLAFPGAEKRQRRDGRRDCVRVVYRDDRQAGGAARTAGHGALEIGDQTLHVAIPVGPPPPGQPPAGRCPQPTDAEPDRSAEGRRDVVASAQSVR